jgi:hypothetical protein
MFEKNSIRILTIFFMFSVFVIKPLYAGTDYGETTIKPWAGYYWPLLTRTECTSINQNLYESSGPLDKYDQAFGQSSNSSATQWEVSYNRLANGNWYRSNGTIYGYYSVSSACNSVGWFGHCHAWAPASILEPQPTTISTFNSVTFDVGDKKGLIVEAYDNNSTTWVFQSGDPRDSFIPTDAWQFHSSLHTYIKSYNQPLIMDINSTAKIAEIWNYPVYKYLMNWTDSGRYRYYTTTIYFPGDDVHPDYVDTYSTPSSAVCQYTVYDSDNNGIFNESDKWTWDANSPYFVEYGWFSTGAIQNNPNLSLSKVKQITSGSPDLLITSISLSPSSPTVNGTFTATVTVKNQGTASGDGRYLDVWANQPSNQTCGADGNQYATVGTLAAGQSKTFTFAGLPAGAAGTKTFRTFVDSYCQTAESSEANNHSTKTYTVGADAGKPDLVITSASLIPSSPEVNGTFTATVTVRNQGTASGDGRYLDVWANQPSVQSCGADGNQYANVGTLTAGQSKIFTFSGLPAGTAGTRTFRAFVDSYCQTVESNEGNNQLTLGYTVGSGTGMPDFVITGVSLGPTSPSANGTFTATVTVKNQGTASGDGKYLDVWANQPSVQSCGADGNQYANVGTLTAGQSKTFTFSGLSAGSAGSKTFRALLDSYCQTAESNESNNQSTKAYSVF